MDPLQQAQGELQKLKMVYENQALKLARCESRNSELEVDNQIMFQRLQQLEAIVAATPPAEEPVDDNADAGTD
jgi:hypothetical protein